MIEILVRLRDPGRLEELCKRILEVEGTRLELLSDPEPLSTFWERRYRWLREQEVGQRGGEDRRPPGDILTLPL